MSTTRTRVLGTTRLEEAIGEGGMAQVFRGNQRGLGRQVAVKVMLPKIARSKDMAARFRREARTLATLHHENIVAIHDLIEKNGQTFMVLEYVEGTDVGALIEDATPLPFDVSLIIATGVARALEHAHFRRVVHRDVKPANVMVSKRGEVKLADFGIAKDLQENDLTQTGFVVGTPSYLAPELLKGARADHRADLYAVGVLLFQCVTGHKPFEGRTPEALFGAILNGQRKKVRALAPECPKGVEKIVDRCLERDIDRRYQRAADLRRDLEGELNRCLEGNPSARLVGFLFARGQANIDDLATLDIGELAASTPDLGLSTSDLSALEAKREASIEIDVQDEPLVDEETGTTEVGRRWPKAAIVLLALIVLAGVAVYVLAPIQARAALESAFQRVSGG